MMACKSQDKTEMDVGRSTGVRMTLRSGSEGENKESGIPGGVCVCVRADVSGACV
jgi:hypothetical protein